MQTPPPVNLVVEIGFSSASYAMDTDSGLFGVWTDVSSRLLSFDMHRGRQDQTARFEPGVADLVLDGTDRMLDPLFAGSMCELALGKGLPWCPIRVRTFYYGLWWPIFTGYVSGEMWRNQRNGDEIEVKVEAVDRMGLYARIPMPTSPYAVTVKSLGPDWWVRSMGAIGGPGSPIPDQSGNSYATSLKGPTGLVASAAASMIPGDQDGAFAFPAHLYISLDGGVLEATTSALTVTCVWAAPASGTDQEVMSMFSAGGSTLRWRVYCDSSGVMRVVICNTSGTAVTYAYQSRPGGGRWDDDQPHQIQFVFKGGTYCYLGVDDQLAPVYTAVPATMAGPLIIANETHNPGRWDEVAYWHTYAFTGSDVYNLAHSFLGDVPPFSGDVLGSRANRWLSMAGVSEATTERFGSTTDPLYAGISQVPGNLGEALQTVTDSQRGATWATRLGRIRMRSLGALTRSTWAAFYATPKCHLTDEPTPATSPPPVRRSALDWSGVRSDKVVNVSRVKGGPAFAARNEASITRYREQVRDWQSDLANFYVYADLANQDVARWSSPQVELNAVTLYPAVDTLAADFVVRSLELEVAVKITETRLDGTKWTDVWNVQREEWSWQNGSDWTVTLTLADS